MLIVYNKQTKQAFEVPDIHRAASYTRLEPDDISWQVKRTGRYDNYHYVIIPLNPEPDEPIDGD